MGKLRSHVAMWHTHLRMITMQDQTTTPLSCVNVEPVFRHCKLIFCFNSTRQWSLIFCLHLICRISKSFQQKVRNRDCSNNTKTKSKTDLSNQIYTRQIFNLIM